MLSGYKAHIFLLGANLLYGANYSIAKIALNGYVGPFGFIFIRVGIALLLYALFHRFFIGEKVAKTDIPRLAACGLFGVAINQLMFFKGLSLTSEIHASLLMITAPIAVLLISRIILGNKIKLQSAAGVLVGASGVAWLIMQAANSGGQPGNPVGDLFILVNAVSYGTYLVLVKPLMLKYHPVTVVKWIFTFGFLIVAPVGYGQFSAIEFNSFPTEVWLSIFYVVLGTTFFAYLLNSMALKSASPTLVSTYIYTQPLIATLISVLIGSDRLSIDKLLAGILIIAGVFLVSAASRLPRKATAVAQQKQS